MATFRDRIREMLKERGWRQEDLAERSGVTAPTVSRYLAGERERVGVDELSRIAEALGVTLSWLYEEHGPKYRSLRADPDLSIVWAPDVPEAVRLEVEREVLEERAAHHKALVPYWQERMRLTLARHLRQR